MRLLYTLGIITILVSICLPAYSKDLKKYDAEYFIEDLGTATQGNYLIRVTLSSKSKKPNDSELIIAAIHGVLFRGFSNSTNGHWQKPMAGSETEEIKHLDFYYNFFSKDGNASTFGNIVTGSRTVVKSEKLYKVSAIVNIRKEALHKYLVEAGIIKSLNDIF